MKVFLKLNMIIIIFSFFSCKQRPIAFDDSILNEIRTAIKIESKIVYGSESIRDVFYEKPDYFSYMDVPGMYVPEIKIEDINKIKLERFMKNERYMKVKNKKEEIIDDKIIHTSERTTYYFIMNNGREEYAGKYIFIFFLYPNDRNSGYGYWIDVNGKNEIVRFNKRIRNIKRDYNNVSEVVETIDLIFNNNGYLKQKEIRIENINYIDLSIYDKYYIYDNNGKLIKVKENTEPGFVDFERDEWDRLEKGQKPYPNCWWWELRQKKLKQLKGK